MNFPVIIIDGLIYSSWLFIVSTGLTLVYGVMRILNMAHGSMYAIGAYTAASLVGIYFNHGYTPIGSYFVFITGSMLAGIISGIIIERGILRVMYGKDEVIMVIVTYAVLLILEDIIKLIWGVEGYYAFQPYTFLGRSKLFGISFTNYDLSLIGAAIIIAFILWFWLNKTRFGKLLIAVINDHEISMAMGINVKRVYIITFAVGSLLGALAGGLTAPGTSIVPGMGIQVIILAFAVVVIGGMGSIEGALIGSLLVGMVRSFAVHLLPQIELFVIYGVMAFILAIRPNGLFAKTQVRKI
jgi:branched-chain amino acid transport system permease protein